MLVACIMAITAILGAAYIGISLNDTKNMKYQENGMKAYYLARSGADAVAVTIMSHPDRALELIDAPRSESNTQIDTGSFDVDIEKGTWQGLVHEVVVSATGYAGNVHDTVVVTLKQLTVSELFDKAMYANSNLDLKNMVINGDVQSAGQIVPPKKEEDFNGTAYPNQRRDYYLPEFPDPPSYDMGNPVNIGNKQSLVIDSSYTFSSIDVGNGGTLIFRLDDSERQVMQIVADSISIDEELSLELANPDSIIELYINNSIAFKTKGSINNALPRNLFIYLAAGSSLDIQANKTLNAYIIGPDATVSMQSNKTTINGAIIADTLEGGNGTINYVAFPESGNYFAEAVRYEIVKWSK